VLAPAPRCLKVEARARRSVMTGERRTQRQELLRSLCAFTASVCVMVDGASEYFLCFGTAVPERLLKVGVLYGGPAAGPPRGGLVTTRAVGNPRAAGRDQENRENGRNPTPTLPPAAAITSISSSGDGGAATPGWVGI
jgi:hypothetical protein